jgi:hypothetical protein
MTKAGFTLFSSQTLCSSKSGTTIAHITLVRENTGKYDECATGYGVDKSGGYERNLHGYDPISGAYVALIATLCHQPQSASGLDRVSYGACTHISDTDYFHPEVR